MSTALPSDLKSQLDALAPSESASLEADLQEAITDISQITVDDSIIDVSEAESKEDQDFLREAGHAILLTDAKADWAIDQITKKIRGRASLEKGKYINAVQERFGSLEGKCAGLMRFWYSIGYWHTSMKALNLENSDFQNNKRTQLSMAQDWARAYRAVLSFKTEYSYLGEDAEELVLACTDSALKEIDNLPADYKSYVLGDIADGVIPTESTLKEVKKEPEVKLSKAQEMLERAKKRQQEAALRIEKVKADPDIPAKVEGKSNPEYKLPFSEKRAADLAVANFEQQIKELEKQIKERDEKLAAEAKAAKKVADELAALKKDDDQTRKRRINTLSQTLVSQVPDLQSGLVKFFAEKDYYEKAYMSSIDEAAKALYDYLKRQYEEAS